MFASLQIIWPQSGLCRPSEIFLFSTDSGLISRMTELQITTLADDSLNDDATHRTVLDTIEYPVSRQVFVHKLTQTPWCALKAERRCNITILTIHIFVLL